LLEQSVFDHLIIRSWVCFNH